MKKAQRRNWLLLELHELIRMNQLVRRKVDYEGYVLWYRSLDRLQQRALIDQLLDFAYEAGVSETDWLHAIARLGDQEAGLYVAEKLSSLLRAGYRESRYPDWQRLRSWLTSTNDARREIALDVSVSLFGLAEGRAYRNETERYCNHWWHRDLLDDRVVKAILEDSHFYTTSMRDDRAIKLQTVEQSNKPDA